MAKIVTETVLITVSKLVRDGTATDSIVSDDFVAGIEAMAQEMVGDSSAVVEVQRVED
jgi:hypothetical protein